MNLLIGSITNELEKLFRKKRLMVVVVILIVLHILLGVLAYFDRNDFKSDPHWKENLQQQVTMMEQQIPQVPAVQKSKMQYELNKAKFQLEHNVNPNPAGATNQLKSAFSTPFLTTILPLIMIVIGADIVAGEESDGTLKTILVRPIGRRNILLGKWIAFFLVSILVMLFSDVLSYVVGWVVIGAGSWSDLIVIGTTNLSAIPVWLYSLMSLGLNVLTVFVISTVMILISVLMRSSATSISISMVVIVIGGLFSSLGGKLKGMKYFFVPHLDLVSHLTNEFSLNNVSMAFSIVTLVVVAIVSIAVSFTVFMKKDMLL